MCTYLDLAAVWRFRTFLASRLRSSGSSITSRSGTGSRALPDLLMGSSAEGCVAPPAVAQRPAAGEAEESWMRSRGGFHSL